MVTERFLGRQLDVDLGGCPVRILSNGKKLVEILTVAAELAGATVMKISKTVFRVSEKKNLRAWTIVLTLSESEISVHTYTEEGVAMLVFFTCGENADPRKAKRYLREAFHAKTICASFRKRGATHHLTGA